MIIVLIIVIVSIVFLGIYIRKNKPIVKEDAEMMNFLSSSLRYTTECTKDANYRTLRDLAVDCYEKDIKGISCGVGKNSCSVLNSTYFFFLNKIFPAGRDRPLSYSEISFFFQINISDDYTKKKYIPDIIIVNKSNCAGVLKAASQAINLEEGNIVIEVEICKVG